MHGATVKTDV